MQICLCKTHYSTYCFGSVGEFIFITRPIFPSCQLLLKVATQICNDVGYLSAIFCLCNPNVTLGFFGLAVSFIQRLIYKTVPEFRQRFNNSEPFRVGDLFALLKISTDNSKQSTLLLGEVKKKKASVYLCKSRASPSLLLCQDLIWRCQYYRLEVPLFHSWMQTLPKSRCEDVWM